MLQNNYSLASAPDRQWGFTTAGRVFFGWGVLGELRQAAKELGVPYGKITMAVAYGNMLGNMYQPFWSLPLLGLMGLRARDIMGFCLVLFVVCLPVLGLALFL